MVVLTILAATILAPPSVRVRIEGEGYLRFVRDGRTVYAREALVTIDKGNVVGEGGLPIVPRTQALGDPEALRIERDGRIIGVYQGSDRLLGKTVVAVFPDDVRPVEDKGWLVSSARAITGQPGSQGFGAIVVVAPASSAAIKSFSSTTISLKKIAEVKGDSFTLADIADIEASPAEREKIESYQIATTPALGVEYKLTQEMVLARLRRYGNATDAIRLTGEPSVTVMRKGQRVSHQMFVDQAVAESAKRNVRVTVGEPPTTVSEMIVPEGRLSLVVASFERSGSRINVKVDVFVDDKRFNGRLVTLLADVPVVSMTVGQSVKLIVRSNSAVVETTGKVKSVDKATGLVTVQSVTGATMTGRAMENGSVEVEL